MKISRSLVVLCAVALSVVAAKKRAKLKVVTKFKPEECSRTAQHGDIVEVHYTGSLEDGSVFDSSRVEGRDPIQFPLGGGRVIKGWEEGILGMCVGEQRTLTIPPHLAYGDQGTGPIPGGATLTFETELVSIQGSGSGPPIQFNFQKWLPFIAVPLLIGYVVYQLWMKAANAPTAKELKESRKKGKRR